MKKFWGCLEPKIRAVLMVVALLGLLYVPVYAIINIAGVDVIPGWGVRLDNDSTEVNITEVWTDSLWEMVYDMIDTTVASGRALDSVIAWGNMINVHQDSIASWANKVNAHEDTIGDWTSLVNESKDSLTSWANEVNAATDTIATWTSLVNEAKDSLTSWANEVNAATDSLGDWTSLVNEAKDSLTSWANKVNTTLQEYDHFWSGADLSLRTGFVDEIAVIFPLANDSNAYFVRHVHGGTTDNEVDTVVFSGYLPIGIDASGVDSITYNLRTSMEADSVCVQVKVWKRDADDLGALALCDSVAAVATTAGAWEHKTTGALGVAQADAGDVLEVWFIVTFGSQVVGVLADHDKPKVWYTGK